MGDDGIDLFRTVICERTGGQRESVAGIDHIVNKDRNLVPNIADEDLHPVRAVVLLPFPLAVDQREFHVELVRYSRHPSIDVSMRKSI